jgi:hypothetical protein
MRPFTKDQRAYISLRLLTLLLSQQFESSWANRTCRGILPTCVCSKRPLVAYTRFKFAILWLGVTRDFENGLLRVAAARVLPSDVIQRRRQGFS